MVLTLSRRKGRLLASDSFTGVSTTALTAHAPERGGPWSYLTACAWQIQASNTAKKTTNSATTSRDAAILNAGRANHRARATVAFGSAPSDALVVRSTGTEADGYFTVSNNGTLWIIHEYDGNITFTVRGSVASTVASTTGVMEVVAKGQVVQFLYNGVLTLTYAAATRNQLTGTYAGIRSAAVVNGATYDNFQVRAA
jgi:hypothetical protein